MTLRDTGSRIDIRRLLQVLSCQSNAFLKEDLKLELKRQATVFNLVRCPRVLKKRVIRVRTLGDCVGELAMCDPGCGESVVYRSSWGTSSLDDELSAERRKEKRKI